MVRPMAERAPCHASRVSGVNLEVVGRVGGDSLTRGVGTQAAKGSRL